MRRLQPWAHSYRRSCANAEQPQGETPSAWPVGQENIFEERSLLGLLHSTAVYRACSWQWLANWTPSIIGAAKAVMLGRPTYWLIRNTIFKQFCGGENIEQVRAIAKDLASRNVKVILDYAAEPDISPSTTTAPHEAVEAGHYYDSVRDNILSSITAASGTDGSVVAVKLTGLFRNNVLEEISELLRKDAENDPITPSIKLAFDVGRRRLQDICDYAKEKRVVLAIDAEQSFVQDAIDFIALDAMKNYNSASACEKPLLINTYQMYRKDGLQRLKRHLENSKDLGFCFGAKIVRGAYVVGERIWAGERNYECPVFETAAETHAQYDAAIEFLFEYVTTLPPSDKRQFRIIFATHNFPSLSKAASLFRTNFEQLSHVDVSFAQLYGMNDSASFSLAKAGYPVYKYLPFGPVDQVMPYLIRRSQENSSVFGLAQSDASLMWAEIRSRCYNRNGS